jgi:predicted alpha/beta superfamily hydrolase
MIIRTIREAARSVAFKWNRKRIHERAIASKEGILTAAESGFLVPDIQQYAARGPNGAYSVFVVLPPAPPPKNGYPVLYLLDGNAWIAGATETLRLQARFAKDSCIEPVMIVAVGYPGTASFDLGRRAFDYLPKHTSKKLSDRFMQGAPWHQPGGAEPFLDFLTGALRTDIAARYPTDPGRQILCGHSFGGFFALRTFLTRPTSFHTYAALSPSLWWDDGRLVREADALIANMPRDLDADVLIAVAGDETPGRPKISDRMIKDAANIADKLARAGLSHMSVDFRVAAGENHQSVPFTMFSTVLRFSSKRSSEEDIGKTSRTGT